jgi:uncharacterized protein YcfL
MKYLIVTLFIVLPACSQVMVKTVDPKTNISCEASYSRFWYDQEGLKVEVCGGKASVDRSNNNTEALNSLLPLIVKAAAVVP